MSSGRRAGDSSVAFHLAMNPPLQGAESRRLCWRTGTIEVSIGENGKIVVLRQTGTDGDAREQHNGRHPIHAPTARLVVASTSVGSPWDLIALCDLDHVKDAVSDRHVEDARWLAELSRFGLA